MSRKKGKTPLSSETVRCIKRKQRLWTRYLETRDSTRYRDYCKARNKVNTVTRNERKRHEKQIAESAKTNCKTYWKYVNSKRKSISGISELHTKVNGTEFIASTDSEIAEVLAEFFSSVFTLQSDNPVDSGKRYCDNFSSDELFNSKEVNKLLKDLNTSKSPGPDQVHPTVLFELANTIDSPLSSIFNESFKSVTVHQRWKIGQISALFKKGDKTSPSNYRPVSLTSIICKMMEKLVRQRIVQHMKSYNLFTHHNKENPHHNREKPHHNIENPYHNKENPHHNTEKPHHNTEKPYHNREKAHHIREKAHQNGEKAHHNNDKPHHNRDNPHHTKEKPHLDEEKPHDGKEGSNIRQLRRTINVSN
ncbi:unnamed protein product [Mytilus edulis]|uniref:Uncharacterized protein n=1 Tax=Mytilus edulis TaxID=6550 RepID=A0A8S3TNX7_MYTED|nr:unnamed protein product [Mytilus edulis]